MTAPTARELLTDISENIAGRPAVAGRLLAARVEKVLALHRKSTMGDSDQFPCCAECTEEYRVAWPCPTVRILNGEEP
jgi:hypothetical protein